MALTHAYLIALAAVCIPSSTGFRDRDPKPIEAIPLPGDWTKHAALVAAIADSTPWTSEGPDSSEEWIPVLEAARDLQQSHPSNVEAALIAYMIHANLEHRQGISLDSESKPMLILRVMFDLPMDGGEACGRHNAAPCGGLVADDAHASRMTDPVSWTDRRPELTSFRVREAGPKSGPAYQPQNEYRFFRSKFAYRSDLDDCITRLRRGDRNLP